MSETVSKKNDARVNAGHLTNSGTDEDWGSMPQPKTKPRVADDDLERELAQTDGTQKNDDEEDEVEETAASTPVPTIDTASALQQLTQLQGNMPTIIAALQTNLEEINQRRAEQTRLFDTEEAGVRKQLNFALVLTGQPPIPEPGAAPVPKKRGRKPGSTNSPPATASGETPAASGEEAPKRRGGTGKRFQNDLTLKDVIVVQMLKMPNYTGGINDIAAKAMNEGGYRTTSTKPTNTVRIQVYRLVEEGKVYKVEGGDYNLTKVGITAAQQIESGQTS
jgi:hypothetical protein